MNQDVFFKNFELLADAPNGVQKLRELILQLAVMGKLVPQDPNDEPASVLIEKIKAEKEEFLKERKISKVEKLFPPKLTKVPYDLPKGWEWARIGDICWKLTDGSHNPPPKKDTGIPMLSSQNIENSKINFAVSRYITEEDYKQEKSRAPVEGGDVFLTIVGTIGRSAVVPENMQPCAIQRSVALLGSKIYPYFLCAYLQSPVSHEFFETHGKGTAQKGIYLNKVSLLHVPIPPLAEQKRIVAKVDELMALCDKLEARRQKKQELQSKLNSAALERMLSAENKEEFEQYWQRICENFDLLYDNPENVEKLRQAILQLAVQGKLVPQNPEDEPASVLIEKIELEKENLVKKGEIKKSKAPPLIEVSEIPYELPETWEWVSVDEIAKNIEYGTSEKASEIRDGIPVLRMNNIQGGKITYDDLKYLPESIKDLPRLFLKHNDLLFNRTNSYELVGKTGIFKGEDDTFTLASYLIRVSLFSEFVIPDFINMSLNSDYFRKTQIEPEITQQCGQANFNGTKLKNSLVPLPPLAEQKRIVEKVEQFMGLCDELEAKLRKSREDSEKLMEAVVKGLLEGAAAEI